MSDGDGDDDDEEEEEDHDDDVEEDSSNEEPELEESSTLLSSSPSPSLTLLCRLIRSYRLYSRKVVAKTYGCSASVVDRGGRYEDKRTIVIVLPPFIYYCYLQLE